MLSLCVSSELIKSVFNTKLRYSKSTVRVIINLHHARVTSFTWRGNTIDSEGGVWNLPLVLLLGCGPEFHTFLENPIYSPFLITTCTANIFHIYYRVVYTTVLIIYFIISTLMEPLRIIILHGPVATVFLQGFT